MTPPNESLTPLTDALVESQFGDSMPAIIRQMTAHSYKLERDLSAIRAAADGLEEIIALQKHTIGPHFIRSCGVCDKCQGPTPNGTLRICRKCLGEATKEALARYAEAKGGAS